MSDLDLYKETILEEAAHPANKGMPAAFDTSYRFGNASCGDMFTVYIELDQNKNAVKKITWEGEGCAISTAAMSTISQDFVGKSLEEIKKTEFEAVGILLGLTTISPARISCVSVGLKAIQKALTLAGTSSNTV